VFSFLLLTPVGLNTIVNYRITGLIAGGGMRIAIASDHAGFQYKEQIKLALAADGHVVKDFGTFSEDPVDYPLFMRPAAEAVARGEFDRGIVLGGSGNGEAMVANRVQGIRCALCWNAKSAEMARRHNDANMISLGQRMIPLEQALEIVQIWLTTPFDGGRHIPRIRQIDGVGPRQNQ
jgi:ribose 5-phosphate isomerase B